VRDRWVAVRRDAGRRRLRVLIVVATVLAVLTLAWGASVSPFLDVDHLRFRGLHRVTAAQVEDASGIHPGDAMLWLDAGQSVRGIEALPFVRRASVKREWPGTVRVTVVERRPVAWLAGPTSMVVVDGTGRVLETVAAAPPGMPQLLGAEFVPGPGATISPVGGARVAAGLTGLLVVGTRSVTTTAAGVTLQLANGPEVRMGSADHAGVKLRAALAVLAATAGTEVHYIDVTVPTNPVAG
jgi:cell division protein FtsQ